MAGAALASALATADAARAELRFQSVRPDQLIGSLAGKQPLPTGLKGIIANRNWAIRLGKSLFWDMQAGSDGQACASCHFQAGADSRHINQLNPGQAGGDNLFGGLSPTAFVGKMGDGGDAGPNLELTPDDFPFRKLTDVNDRRTAPLFDTNDVSGSAGTTGGAFLSLKARAAHGAENCDEPVNDVFNSPTYPTRNVTGRNTPSAVNAAFNDRNFWDGRANNIFNGLDPFGMRTVEADPLARVLRLADDGVTLEATELRNDNGGLLKNASLASQAVGPPLSDVEMSCAGKSFRMLGRKLIALRALSTQEVAADDSVLGPIRHISGVGVKQKYEVMIQKAFDPKWWSAPGVYDIVAGVDGAAEAIEDPNGFTQMEMNFSMFWGLAIMLYEQTLISDDAPFDRWVDAGAFDTMPTIADFSLVEVPGFGDPEKRGLKVFLDEGRCVNCHIGAEFTFAASHREDVAHEPGRVEHMFVEDAENGPALYDKGFYNIGVRPTAEDIGLGGTDPYGNPLSYVVQYLDQLQRKPVPDVFSVDECSFEVAFQWYEFPSGGLKTIFCSGVSSDPRDPTPKPTMALKPKKTAPEIPGLRLAINGAFKTPSLRNVGLTAPYFHNGGQATLRQVVDFYSRGGDRTGDCKNGAQDSTAKDGLCNLDPDINTRLPEEPHREELKEPLSEQQRQDLVAFLLALTDERVACEQAPFDHPQLVISHGHQDIDADFDGRADDDYLELPAVGAGGRPQDACLKNSGDLFDVTPPPLHGAGHTLP